MSAVTINDEPGGASKLTPSAVTHNPIYEDTAPLYPTFVDDGTGGRILRLCHIVCSKANRRKAAEFKNRRRLACLRYLSTSPRAPIGLVRCDLGNFWQPRSHDRAGIPPREIPARSWPTGWAYRA